MALPPRISVSTTRRAIVGIGARLPGLAGLLAAVAAPTAAAPRRKKRRKKPKTVRRFARNMVGANEAPPESGDASGLAQGVFRIKNGNTICVRFAIAALSPGSAIQGAHIHQGPPGIDGPIVVDFSGRLSGCVRVPKALARRVATRPSAFYANIHTNLHPDGAVRAQLQR